MGVNKPMSLVLEQYAAGPLRLEDAIEGLGEAGLDTPVRKEGWTVREVVHHIADGDDIWKRCVKMAIGNQDAVFDLGWYGAMSQEEWAWCWRYADRSIDESLQLLKANRNHILQLLEHVPDAWDRSVLFRSPDGKTQQVTVGEAVQIQTDHLAHHLRRVLAMKDG